MRFGTVAIVGRTNVGKSTFLNACLGEKLAIVSPLPQTTRDELLGIVHRPGAQIAFTDTPGLHRPKNELGRRMNAKALDTLRSHDLTVFIADASATPRRKPAQGDWDPIHPDDRRLLSMLQPDLPCVLVLNKTDLIGDKSRLLPLMAAYHEAHPFVAIIPTSVLAEDGVDRVLEEIARHLPEADGVYPEDTVTDRPMNYFAREYIREQVLLQTRGEVPHATAVTIDRFEEGERLCRISATIHVEKVGQRSILIGQGGERIKELGTKARLEIERLTGKQVHLELFVRVSDRWKDVPRQLSEMGYDATSGVRSLENVLPTGAAASKKSKPKKRPQQVERAPSPPRTWHRKPRRPRGELPASLRGARDTDAKAGSSQADKKRAGAARDASGRAEGGRASAAGGKRGAGNATAGNKNVAATKASGNKSAANKPAANKPAARGAANKPAARGAAKKPASNKPRVRGAKP